MSLVADPDYVLRVLQLQYLRRLPDPLGPSTLTFPPSFSPYLESSDLSNPAVWPELDLVRAPKPVGSERIPGVGGLKYSETIVGKNGGFSAGMRVRGRRRTFKSRQNRAGSLRHDEAPKMLNPVNEHEEVPEGAEADAEDQAASSDDNEDAESRALKLNAPKVTIQSPQRSPTTPTSGDPTTIQAKNPRRNTLQSISERFKSVEDLVNPEESDPEQDAVPQDQLSRRSRPVTLLHTPEYSHDKELSDALLWQEDRDRYQNRSGITNDLDSPSLTSPIVPGPSSPTEGSATEDVEPSTADTQQSRLGAMLAQSQVDPSSFSYSGLGNDSASTSYNIANSSASIMEGASSAALQSRRAGRLRRGPSEPELARFKDTPPPTQNPEPQKQQQSSKPILPLDLQQAPPPPPPMVGLQPGQRRERRRVNVSGKIALAAHPPPPPPPQAQVQEPIPSNVPTSSQAPDPRTGVAEAVGSGQLGKITSSPSRLRSRAGTDPPPSALASASKTEALYARRQASSDAPQPTASTLGRPIGPREPSNQQAKSGPNTDRTSPLKPLALLSPKPVEDRHSLSSRATSSPAPLKFEKTPIAPPNAVKEPKSNLSAILTAQESSATCVNPFNAFYGAVLTRPGDSSGLSLKLFFSYAGGTSAKFSVKKDATAEEVIGCALFKYWELDLKPTLLSDAEKEAWDGESLSGKLDPASWNLHIVEDEDTGEVDDDFPALDRTKAISAFSFNAFALVEASSADFEVNQSTQAQITRRPSRIIARPGAQSKVSTENVQPAPSSPLPTSSSRYLDITGDKADDAVSTSLRADRTPGFTPSSYAAPGGKEVLLRIKIPVPGLESVISTVKVTTNTYLADVIETICRKRKEHLGSAKDWVILLADRDILAPTDRTVESLQGSYKLRLMKKDELPGSIKPSQTHGATGNVNPSTSVYKRASEPPQPKYVSASDVSGHTQRWRLFRKQGLSLTKHERILSLDGEWLQFLHPSGSPGRTAPFHITQVVRVKPSKRVDNGFKLFFEIDKELKRYDLEAQKSEHIGEIIEAIDRAKALRTQRRQ